jgi:hypothetical protein
MFENKVNLVWSRVKLDRSCLLVLEYDDSGFDIFGSNSVHGTLCLLCAFGDLVMIVFNYEVLYYIVFNQITNCGLDVDDISYSMYLL